MSESVMHPVVHVQVHSEFSVSHGMLRLNELLDAVVRLKMPAVALTDTMNTFAAIKFTQAALKRGIKPLLGAELLVRFEGSREPSRMVVLCQSLVGFRHLSMLLTEAYQSAWAPEAGPVVDWEACSAEAGSELLWITAGLNSPVAQAFQAGDAVLAQKRLEALIGRYPGCVYVGITRLGEHEEGERNVEMIQLADALDVPLLALNDVCFLKPEDHMAHEARVAIHRSEILNDPSRRQAYGKKQFLRSSEQMHQRFADLPDALYHTLEVAKRCHAILETGQVYLPDFPVPDGLTLATFLRQSATQGLAARFAEHPVPEEEVVRYEQRLAHELDTIIQMGFPGYFLIVADFIRWAKTKHIPVGPGRGSGAGSLVAYVLGITDVDPLPHELLFERFLNPERVSMPDFDVDFCMDGRDRVIDYVADRYGQDRVAQIITYGTMAAKAVVRDVGRILQYPYGFVDKLAKLIPMDLGITLTLALEQEPELARRVEEEEEVKEIFELALRLEGLTRNVGKHAGGVVVAPKALTHFTPLYLESPQASPVTQFDKDDIEKIGLVKFDFLGLRTLTIIDHAVRIARTYTDAIPEHMHQLPLDDAKTYRLLQSGQTTAVFQLESRGMRDLILRLEPDSFDDVVALVALFRPGPLQSGMVDDYVDRKHGRASVVYPHPSLEPILKPTYGVILYQEQVMQIAQVLAGYTLGGADLLRRAMGKKKPEEMAKQRDIFMSGAKKNGIDAQVAKSIFDLMEKFAGYGFNKSHSVAYALLSYQTAWLKAHHPAAFMAAVLSADMDSTDKVLSLVKACREMGLTVIPPDIQCCDYRFTINDDKAIIYGLGAIKGVGQAVIEGLVAARQDGPFRDLLDLCRRSGEQKLNKRVLSAFIRSGALDGWGQDRSILEASVEKALLQAEQRRQQKASGQLDLLAQLHPQAEEESFVYVSAQPWTREVWLQGEKETLGFYVSGHPLAEMRDELTAMGVMPIASMRAGQTVRVAGFVVSERVLTNKQGRRFAFAQIEDETGAVDCGFFGEVFGQYREQMKLGPLLVVSGSCAVDDYTQALRVQVDDIHQPAALRASRVRGMKVTCVDESLTLAWLEQLRVMLALAPAGDTVVTVAGCLAGGRVEFVLGEAYRINITDDLREALAQWSSAEVSWCGG